MELCIKISNLCLLHSTGSWETSFLTSSTLYILYPCTMYSLIKLFIQQRYKRKLTLPINFIFSSEIKNFIYRKLERRYRIVPQRAKSSAPIPLLIDYQSPKSHDNQSKQLFKSKTIKINKL